MKLFTAAAIALMATQAAALDRPTWSPAKMEETQQSACYHMAINADQIMHEMDKLMETPANIKQYILHGIEASENITDEFEAWYRAMLDATIDGLYDTLADGGPVIGVKQFTFHICISSIYEGSQP